MLTFERLCQIIAGQGSGRMATLTNRQGRRRRASVGHRSASSATLAGAVFGRCAGRGRPPHHGVESIQKLLKTGDIVRKIRRFGMY